LRVLRVCLLFRVVLFFPPLDFECILAAAAELPLDFFDESSKSNKSTFMLALGLALAERLTRRSVQEREIDEIVMELGSTYLILVVRLNKVLNRLGRFLTESIASKLVSGLYDLTIPSFISLSLIGAALLSVSRYTLNETMHLALFSKSDI